MRTWEAEETLAISIKGGLPKLDPNTNKCNAPFVTLENYIYTEIIYTLLYYFVTTNVLQTANTDGDWECK